MYSSQKSVIQTLLKLEKQYGDKAGKGPGERTAVKDLQTLRKLVSGMSERAYRVHIEDGERQSCLFRKMTAVVALLLLSMSAFGQSGYEVSKLKKADPYFVTSFTFANCQNQFDTMYTIKKMPVMIRSRAVGSVYEFTEFIPFKVYWTPWERPLNFDHSYFLSSGRCRGFSFSLPAKRPGIYTTVFEHREKPCVMQIAVTPKDLHEDGHLVELRFFQRCEPNVIFRRYEAETVYLNLPDGQPLDIEVWWKEDDGTEEFGPSKEGFQLLKTVHSNTSYRFKYRFPKYGIYRFRMKSPADRYYHYDFVRIRPDGYEQCGAMSLD